jgi:polar amino acid transport system substrate-binding protein
MSSNEPIPNAPRGRSGPALRFAALACATAILVTACGSSSRSAPSVAAPTASSSSSASGVDKAAAALLPSSLKTAGVLNDGVNLPNPPLEYQVNGKGAYTGFDVELAAAIAAKLGLKIHYENLAFTALLTSLDAGRVDIVLSGLFDTTTREAKYSIVDYLNTGSQIVTTSAAAAKAPSLVSLCGKTVETAVGTAFSAQLTTLSTTLCAGKPALKVLAVGSSFAEEILQVKTGRAVAAIATTDNIAYSQATDPGAYVKVGKPFDEVPYGIDIPKAQTGLTKAIQMALADVIADGTYAKIAAKFDEQSGERASATVDAA